MSNSRFKLVLSEEADHFIKGLPYAAAKKIDSNNKTHTARREGCRIV